MNDFFCKSPWARFRSSHALLAALAMSAALLCTSASTHAEAGDQAAQELSHALEPVSCGNVTEVARLYKAYDVSLGASKPSAALVAKAAYRLAECLPRAVQKATKACLDDCKPGGFVAGFMGPGSENPRELVQAIHSLTFFARDAGRTTSAEVQALAAKYKVLQASAMLGPRAFAMKQAFVPEADNKRYQELQQKPKGTLTDEERAFVERIGGWDESL